MNFQQFIESHDVLYAHPAIDSQLLTQAQDVIGIPFGEQLQDYLLHYGFLIYEDVELYGLNSRQGLESDLVRQTLYLHQYFDSSRPCIALESLGDGRYALMDGSDMVSVLSTEENKIEKTGMKLFDYLLERFQDAEKGY